MHFIADLHIHSHFSRATSKKLIPEYLDYWAGIKGVKVVGTGDFTHPGWLAEMKEKFEPEGNGLFKLKKSFRHNPLLGDNETRFLLTAEISNIYKKGEKVRKVHNVVMVPGFEDAEKINRKLEDMGGNLKSDGRPILGLDSQNLLELVLDCNEKNVFIPAHIWTPWFSMLGSKSGFDSPEECFGPLWKHIHSIETGLSTDAPMNWLCSFLDRVTLISNSDAHSPDRLGRNANVFDTELSFSGIAGALESGTPDHFLGTIDLFPQEGKYHYDGHRKCNVCWNPATTIRNNAICPECGKPVTVGVMNRVIRLSDREDYRKRKNRLPFRSIIPLKELLAEIAGVGEKSKTVQAEYEKIIRKLGNELNLLLNISLEEIEKQTSPVLSEAIRRMRNREIVVKEGFDGEYGQIKVFNPSEIKSFSEQNSLFTFEKPKPPVAREFIDFDLSGIQQLLNQRQEINLVAEEKPKYTISSKMELNPEQQEAVEYTGKNSIILAGPGTGKTKTVISKISWIIQQGIAPPSRVLAITFTNKGAEEMQSRLEYNAASGNESPVVSTFHGFGRIVLEEYAGYFQRSSGFTITDENEKLEVLKSLPGIKPAKIKKISAEISKIKQGELPESANPYFKKYELRLQEYNVFDFDDLIVKPLSLFQEKINILDDYQKRFPFIFVDEFQDTNPGQYELIKCLSEGENKMLCVVGDPNQAIYSFRGGGSQMIDRFIRDFPDVKVFSLKISYRCSQNILSASSGVLSRAALLDGLEEGVKITVSEQATDKSEAEFIAREIVKLSGGLSFFSIDSDVSEGAGELVKSLSDFAVLCRTRHQFRAIEKAFHDHNIPYQAVGEIPFYQQPPFDELLKVYKACLLPEESSYAKWLMRNYDVIRKTKLELLRNELKETSVEKGLQKIREEFFSDTGFDEQDFRRLTGMAGDMLPSRFLSSLKLGNTTDTYNEKLQAVALMTLHASKGLEFEAVFIAGCEQGLIPYNLYNTEVDMQEEARLLYVGMTRSKKFLYLSHARSRKFRNRPLSLNKSVFIDKIEKELIEKAKNPDQRKKDNGQQLDLFKM